MKIFAERPITIETESFELGATLTYPEDTTPCPGVVLAGGSMSHSRDGDLVMDSQTVLSRKAMKHFAHRLAQSKIASIRWDKMGFFESRLKKNRPVENHDHVRVLEAAYERLSTDGRIDPGRLVIAGESAGAYYTSLFAGTGRQASAYVLLGALASSMETLFAFNYHRTVEYARQSEDHWKWVETVAPKALATGLHYKEMFEKARAGELYYRMQYGDQSWDWYLPPLLEELDHDILGLFANLKRPVLILQGDKDMNVPPGDSQRIARCLAKNGNTDYVHSQILNADHSFQHTPPLYEDRLRQRISLDCIKNEYAADVYEQMANWINTLFSRSA